jgi:glycosyltransferase involved in cell wall biosynthesis
MSKIGLVAIGRNEGERLRRCLQSAVGKASRIVYVDSGSTDGSLEFARSLGIDVLELDRSQPFASPRSRNEGFYHLLNLEPDLQYVQFIDGDCELIDGWLERAEQTLNDHPDVAVVCGRRLELFPDRSIYNKLCDLEWNTPIGEAKACGGDSLMRPSAFQSVGGFNPTLIGGGEPELCVRLRREGWKILRIDADMSRHDAAILSFRQWWNRNRRVGHAYAEGSWLHGRSPEQHWVRESRSIWFWGLIWPLLIGFTLWYTHGWSLLLLLGYPLSISRTYMGTRSQSGLTVREAALYATFCSIAKFPLVLGQLQFHFNRLRGRKTKLVEYKAVSSSS